MCLHISLAHDGTAMRFLVVLVRGFEGILFVLFPGTVGSGK